MVKSSDFEEDFQGSGFTVSGGSDVDGDTNIERDIDQLNPVSIPIKVAKKSRKPYIAKGGGLTVDQAASGVLPAYPVYSNIHEGEVIHVVGGDAAVRPYAATKRAAPTIAGKSREGVIPCDMRGSDSRSSCSHSGLATHYVHLPNTPRENVAVACPKHINDVKAKSKQEGSQILVGRLTPKSVSNIQELRRRHTQEDRASLDVTLHTLNPRLSAEEKIAGPHLYKEPTKQSHVPVESSVSLAPIDPTWDPDKPIIKEDRSQDPNYFLKTTRGDDGKIRSYYVRNYDFPKRTTKVAMGNVQPPEAFSPELSHEEIAENVDFWLKNPALAESHRQRSAAGIPPEGLGSTVSSKQSIGLSYLKHPNAPEDAPGRPSKRMLSWEERNAMHSALDKISVEHEPDIIEALEDEQNAANLRRIEARKKNIIEGRKANFSIGNGTDKPKELK